MATSGSFGLLKQRYAVSADRVSITRNAWLPVVLLALAAPGIWCLTRAFAHSRLDATMFGLGFVGVMLGWGAIVLTPWLAPRAITIARDGVVWGGTRHPVETITAVRSSSTELRSSRHGKYLSWTIVIVANKQPLILSLGTRGLGTSTEELTELERAIAGLLLRRP